MANRRLAERARRIAAEPAFHFIVLGLIGFALSHLLVHPPQTVRPVLLIDAQRLAAIRRADTRRTGEPPNDERMRALIGAVIDDVLLLRAAIDDRVHLTDRVIRDRLIRNMRFVGVNADDEEAFDLAVELGMHLSDTVVRSRLIQAAQQRIETPESARDPDPLELQAYLNATLSRFMSEPRVRLRHVFFDAGARDAAELRALNSLERLRANPAEATAQGVGDPLLIAPATMDVALPSLARLLGSEVVDAARELKIGDWSEPLHSSYGLHLLRVEERIEAEPLALDAVANRIRFEILNENRKRAIRNELERLRSHYDIRVAESVEE
jgi:parvulin-like peptidyl-prolyl isomerase